MVFFISFSLASDWKKIPCLFTSSYFVFHSQPCVVILIFPQKERAFQSALFVFQLQWKLTNLSAKRWRMDFPTGQF